MSNLNLKAVVISLLCIISLSSCSDNESLKLIVGKWQCVQWSVDNEEDANSSQNVNFEFKADKTYTYHNSGLTETGTFKIASGKLYTTPSGQLEMAVEIKKLNQDSMIFDMSRGGMPESMVLIRK